MVVPDLQDDGRCWSCCNGAELEATSRQVREMESCGRILPTYVASSSTESPRRRVNAKIEPGPRTAWIRRGAVPLHGSESRSPQLSL